MSRGADRFDRSRAVRALRQRLELHRLSGFEPLLTPAQRQPRPSAAGEPSFARDSDPASESALGGVGRNPSERRTSSSAAAGEPAAASDERDAVLSQLVARVAACTACRLAQGRTRTVFGVGDVTARLLFVGEAPGYDEDQQGEPFVGEAGQLLDRIIAAMGLRREAVYIANVVKCRPPANRVPQPDEVQSCSSYLEAQIQVVRPEVIVALGATATRALLGGELSVGRMRGRFHDWRGIAVMPTYHPAYLLRNSEAKRKVWDDMQIVMARLGLSS